MVGRCVGAEAEPMADDRELSAAEIEAFHREQFVANEDAATMEMYSRVFDPSEGYL